MNLQKRFLAQFFGSMPGAVFRRLRVPETKILSHGFRCHPTPPASNFLPQTGHPHQGVLMGIPILNRILQD